jgi:hypothetical protein
VILLLAVDVASAKSWCASPVVAHEWGVAVLRPQGGLSLPTDLPPWFERSGVAPLAGATPVRSLPADNGVRTLPVVQLWRGDDRPGPIPFALEVGFTQGTAAVWWPPVDALSLHTPERQLAWDALVLDDVPAGAVRDSALPWVGRLREAGPLWVSRGPDSERFVFYEGRTREAPAVTVVDDPRGIRVRNTGDWPVHDVWVVRDGRAHGVPRLAPGEEAAPSVSRAVDAAWRSEVRAGWVDPAGRALVPRRASGEGCVTGRDPAVPVSRAEGHALYAPEVDAMLTVWGERLFGAADHLLYREDVAALDAVMPVSLYTDMTHWLTWRRLGVVLVEP